MTGTPRSTPEGGLAAGTVLDQRYRIRAVLGSGAMATVYAAEDLDQRRAVAVKVLRPEVAARPEAVTRLRREADVLRSLRHAAIVSYTDQGQLEDGTVYLVMELLRGATLRDAMGAGPMEPAALAPIVAGTCAGLHAAHLQGIVHRDLKPENIFLVPEADGHVQVKLLDFGISKVLDAERITQTGEILGTPRYMSPEQLGAEPALDGRVDVYALGVILYEALAGRPPITATNPTGLIVAILNGEVTPIGTVRPDLPEEVAAVVMRALARHRRDRFEGPMALAQAFIGAVAAPPGPVATIAGERGQGRKIPVATQVLGGHGGTDGAEGPAAARGAAPAEPAPRGAAPAGGGSTPRLPIGTFTELPEPPVAAQAPAPRVDRSDPSAPPSWPEPPPEARGRPRGAVAATTAMDATGPFDEPPPDRTSPPIRPDLGVSIWVRGALIMGALVAGALFAGGVVAALGWFPIGERAEPPGSPGSLRAEEAAPGASEREDGRGGDAPEEGRDAEGAEHRGSPGDSASPAGRDDATEDDGVDAGAVDGVVPVPARTAPRRGRRRARRGTEPGADDEAALDPFAVARRALGAGDAARCVEVLTEAITARRASVTALRQRGACFEALGQRQRAIADYRRFCRLVPDHPTVGEVRRIMAGWGQSCP
ncbi:MAG: protein kinase [Sandaracinaceae bacterium]